MARLPEVGSAQIANEYVKVLYRIKFGDQVIEKAIGDRWGVKGDWETVMANSQDAMAAAIKSMAWTYNQDQFTLPRPLCEMALLRISWLVESKFVYSQRSKIARAVGLEEEKIKAVKHWPVFDGWTRQERAVLGFTDAVVNNNGRMADELFDALKETLTSQQIIDLVWCSNLYVTLSKIARILRVEFDDREDPITEVPAPPGFKPFLPTMDISHLEK